MLHQYDYLCTEISEGSRIPQVKKAWSFSHPIPARILADESNTESPFGASSVGGWVGGDAKNDHNARECKVSFQSHEQGPCHGIAGYFETVLYASSTAKVELSTNPVTMEDKSKDMISWFPIFFPLKVRCLDVAADVMTLTETQAPIYTPKNAEIAVSMWRQTDDRSVWYEWLVEVFGENKRPLALSELHSSKKNACLM
jgi:type II protein arginine methyltransferase